MQYRNLYCFLLLTLVLGACKNQSRIALDRTAILYNNQDMLTQVIIYDVFSPPVASRIYSYASLAAFEAVKHQQKGEASLTANMKGFPEMPKPSSDSSYDFSLAASQAFFSTVHKLVFSLDSLKDYEEKVMDQFKSAISDDAVFERSIRFGNAVSAAILQRAATDHYKETRGMAKHLGNNQPGQWQPTSPDYMDATEPHWMKIMPLMLDSAKLFLPPPPPKYNADSNSSFMTMVKEVFDIRNHLTKEQQDIAYFWDDNPFVLTHAGHLTIGNKKQTPGGHWMGITTIACRSSKANEVTTAKAYALVGSALLDGFINCWATKYHYNYVRPVTVINDRLDKYWQPYLQTPPFPEYTSGHSTISASVATVLTKLFGDHFAFHDDADKKYIGVEKDFPSFMAAAEEASVSRLYGGIHYRMSLDTGVAYGKKVGSLFAGLVK